MRATEAIDDARRAMEVCNACRYCEGYCAVFPAMTLFRSFSNGDLSYLANLCHGCSGCFYACQYAPPHEFGINLPKTFAEVRLESYEEYAWPRGLARLFEKNGLVMALATAFGIAAVFLLTALLTDPALLFSPVRGPGAFYAIIPWWVMVTTAGGTFVFSLVALGMGFANFWKDTGGTAGELAKPKPLFQALRDALSLKYLGGGGDGCNDKDESFSMHRRWSHHALFYGFMLCFAATCVATVYDHFLHLQAPYPFFSLPVMLGTVGGIGMTIGGTGMLWIKLAANPAPSARRVLGADYGLLVLLLLTAVTGLLLLALRHTGAMATLLAVHLGVVLALFVMMPYCKFVHSVYRSGALLRFALRR